MKILVQLKENHKRQNLFFLIKWIRKLFLEIQTIQRKIKAVIFLIKSLAKY